MARSLTAIATAIAVATAAFFLSSYYDSPLLQSTWLSKLSNSPKPSDSPSVSTLTKSLHPHLSSGAQIHFPGDSSFAIAADRWQNYAPPTFAAVVQVATEEDVQATVRWANSVDLPFLAISGAHGSTGSLGRFKAGVGIWMRELRSIDVLDDGPGASGKARIGGGVLSGEVVRELWEKGKMAVTGACECTGMVAPMLGGGHGWLQGQEGLMADNLISARVVLANGTAVTVSETEHPDLLWALKGAGHNFGIVTSFDYKILDRTSETEMWSWELFVFKHDRVADVYDLYNGLLGGSMGEQPVEVVHWSYFLNVPDVDPEHPAILFYVMYQSPTGVPSKYTDDFVSLAPVARSTGISTLPDFAVVGMLDMDGPFCQHGTTSLRFPISSVNYSIPALEEVMTTFSNLDPALNGSGDRENGVLMASFGFWNGTGLRPEREAEIEQMALVAGRNMRDSLVRGGGGRLYAYVNYAHGDESLEAMYGYEKWRVERLRGLKREWDPMGRFGWYAPIE
ncbi:hypothetical protein Q7P37_007330 [Cladosporium fusiforme]